MTDIVERLRMHYGCWDEAAAEIERLKADIATLSYTATAKATEAERLRTVLAKIAHDEKNCADYCRWQARRALAQPGDTP
jgi:hypothetical protein